MPIPERIKQAIDAHVATGKPCGHFVTAVLENNLSQALHRADLECFENLREIVSYVHWEITSACHGSKEKVAEWREKGGENGRE